VKFRLPWQKRASLENPKTSLRDPASWLIDLWGGGTTVAGENITANKAIGQTAIGKCIRILAEDVASLPLNLFRVNSNGDKELATDHPLYQILQHQANDLHTAFEWKQITQYHLGGWGAAYSFIDRPRRSNEIRGLIPLMPDRTWPERKDGKLRIVTVMDDGTHAILPFNKVLFLRWFTYDGITPISPIMQHREELGYSISMQKFSHRFFAKGGQLKGVLSTPQAVTDPDKLRKEWEIVYGGNENEFRTAVLENGMEYKQIAVNPDDAQFIETKGMTTADVAAILRIPEIFLNRMNRATWGNAKELVRYYTKHVLRPWLTRYEQQIYMNLLTEVEKKTYTAQFDTTVFMRGDPKEQYEIDRGFVEAGVITPNEVRADWGRNRIEGADELRDPTAVAPAEPDDDDDEEIDQARGADREATRALGKIRKLLATHGGLNEEFTTEALQFLQGDWHEHLQRSLGVTGDEAYLIGERVWRDMTNGAVIEDVLTRWDAELPQLILNGAGHETGTT
jgi:HK97 family phage portal protein